MIYVSMQRIIPHELTQKSSSGDKPAGLSNLFLFGGVFLFLFVAASAAALFFLIRGEIDSQKKLRVVIDNKAGELRASDVVVKATDLEARLGNMRGILENHVFATNALRLLEHIVHPQVRFSGFSFSSNEGRITTQAVARGYSVVAQQIDFIKRDTNVEGVSFEGLSQNDRGDIQFNLVLTVKPAFKGALMGSDFGIPVEGRSAGGGTSTTSSP